MFSFLHNKETEPTNPVLFPSDHGPEAVPQTSRVAHGMRRHVPRLINGVHILHPNIDQVVKGCVIKRHVIHLTIQLVLVESNKAPMVHQVVDGQPLLEDIAKVLLRVL